MRRPVFGVLTILAGAALVHIVASVAVSQAIARHTTRMINLRLFPTETWPALAAGYIASQQPAPVLVIGSSFSYGFPFPAENAFPAILASETRQRVVNASIIGAGLSGLYSMILCSIPDGAIDALLVEIPLVNETSHIVHGGKSSPDCPPPARRSLLATVLHLPWGLGWLPLLDDENAFRREKPLTTIEKVADDFFATAAQFDDAARTELRTRIEDAFRKASRAARRPFLFVTPVYISGVAEGGADAETVQAQFEFALSVCREVAGPYCIDTSPLLTDRSSFSNLTHLNRRGGERIAQIVANALRTVGEPR